MAHTRVMDKAARIIDQCAKGRFIRNINTINVSLAASRATSSGSGLIGADVIDGETYYKTIFVAPSEATVESIYATPVMRAPSLGSGSKIFVDVLKAHTAAGQDITINASGTLRIGGSARSGEANVLTVGATSDATLATGSGNTSLSIGQAVYAKVVLNSGVYAINASHPSYVGITVEWTPNDRTYASP